ncbi:MAG TPA: xanthine dehydrogenase family protein subunit M [Bryobacteraceae bacterium]|jgi:xanthine dehydrogenase YagS FAD-binding subunit
MEAFSYANPTTLAEAAKLLGGSWNDAQILAGGTDLIALMKDYLTSPKLVVNVKNIKELGGISKSGGGLRIGATATFDDMSSNGALRTEYPAIHQAVMGITSPQMRNMGTAGGDLCQRPRCWYFRNGFGLLAMKDGKSLVPEGENKYHAIFGGGPAYFVSASSLGPALIALGGTVKIHGASGARTVDAAKFFVIPKSEDEREIDLKPNEIVAEIHLPSASGVRNATYEIRERDFMDWPVAAASVAMKTAGGKISNAKVILGHVAPIPWEATKAEEYLNGKTIDESTAEEAGKLAAEGAQPLSQNAYKVQLVKVAVKRALLATTRKA